MRVQDIVEQMAVLLPVLVDDFTDQIAVTELKRTGSTVEVACATPHGLVVGQAVVITGAQTPISINTIDRVGVQATLVTEFPHDMTENAGFDVQVSGATEPEFNGTFLLLTVPNRFTITYLVTDMGPISATGDPLLLNGSNIFQTYNGLQAVTAVIDEFTFEYETTNTTGFTPASGTIEAKTSPRITGAVSIDRYLDAYTKQPPEDAWALVALGDAVSNKNKNIDLDSVNNLQVSQFYDQRLIQPVSVFIVLPATSEIMGRKARDRAQELLRPICRSILRAKFDSLVSSGALNPLQLTGHGFYAYNSAFYVHRYDFEAVEQLTVDDCFVPEDDVAFRDIDLEQFFSHGTEEDALTSQIDLDSEPLP